MGKNWKDTLQTVLGGIIGFGIIYVVWNTTLGFLIRMIDEKYRRIGRIILIGIIVVCCVVRVLGWIFERNRRKALAEKYRSVIGNCTLKELPEKLLRLGRKALQEGTLDKAREYLEASGKMNFREAGPDLIRCYHALGMRYKAKELVEQLMFKGEVEEKNYEAGLLAITLGLTDDVERMLRLVKIMAGSDPAGKRRGSKQLWDEANELCNQAAQRKNQEKLSKELDECDLGLQKARAQEKAGNLARAVEICSGTMKNVADDCRDDLKDKLAELAWMAAQLSYRQKKYNDTVKYLNMEDCSRYPSEYYLRVLAQTWDGTSLSYAYMNEAEEAVKRAVQEGIPGAREMQVKLRETAIDLLGRLIRAEQGNLADMEAEERFEAEHGISREEYAERQRRNAAEKARSEQKVRRQRDIELAEREYDLSIGGDGSTMDEKVLTGKISSADYYRYKAKKK